MRTARLIPFVMAATAFLTFIQTATASSDRLATEGRLEAIDSKGETLGNCPLRHTDVSAEISGFITRVTVRQQFHNPFAEKIEAVYVFPLSQNAAVDQMTMKIGKRVIKGQIKERGEARAIYERAKARGNVASLLDQERPNIFTQAVANIEPGEQVDITISYSETLKWKDGQYEFSFPMVVGPRYMPGQPVGQPTTGWAPPTDRVPDANKISPPVTPPGTRTGHDIAIRVQLDAGRPLARLDSRQHEIDVTYPQADKRRAVVTLRQKDTLPNKDFVLVYQTATDEIGDSVLTHTDSRGKFFTIVLQPPKRVRQPAIVPKELFFVIDSSGSMMGFPIETAKKAMKLCIEGLNDNDAFNLMTFSGSTEYCFEKPVPNTAENRQRALAFLGNLQGHGGTEMMEAINGCLDRQDDAGRVRVVCFMTDGYVGNDMEIIDAVKRNAGTARVFAFGIGRSVNRFLLDGMARAGRGEVQYVLDERETAGVAERFYQRVRTPVLTDVAVDFGGLKVSEVYPSRIPDLFSSTPVVIKGQYKQSGRGTITLRGKTGQGPFERKIDVTLPESNPQSNVLAPLWARAKVDELMGHNLLGVQRGQPNPAVNEEILGLGLRFQLLTQFTSFVAVEEKIITKGGQPKTVAVPVEMPEDVKYEGVFGDQTNGLGKGVGIGVMRGSGGSGVGLGGRGSGHRKAMLAAAGGTKGSENAVASSLVWLGKHQEADGHWRFDPSADAEKSYANPGTWKSDSGATALAVLPLLGAGQSHRSPGPYRLNIKAALNWLVQHQKPDGDLSAGGSPKMFSHALATIAICDAYGLTADRTVGRAAQQAIKFIVASQDEKTGGWAEPSGQPCLSLSIWQIWALASGRMAGLEVSQSTSEKAAKFLDKLQVQGKSQYGETGAKDASDTATIVGLMARIYLNSKADAEQKRRLGLLSQNGTSANDAVSNFWGTILLFNCQGSEWDLWNRTIRRQLIDAQVKEGNEAGSWWNPNDFHAASGGRLFQTAINSLMLEVYYRYLPLLKPFPVGNKAAK